MQTPMHHPTDSGLLGDGVRVLTRLIQRARPLIHDQLVGVHDAFRSRLRRLRRRLQQRHRVRRLRGEEAAEQQRGLDQHLLAVTRQTLGQADRVREAWRRRAEGGTAATSAVTSTVLKRAIGRRTAQVDRCLPVVRHGIQQAQARVRDGQPVASTAKVLSLFEPHPRVVKRGKAGAARRGSLGARWCSTRSQVAGGIVTRLPILADNPSECHHARPAIQHHRDRFGRSPCLVTGDRRRPTKGVEETAPGLGSPRSSFPGSAP